MNAPERAIPDGLETYHPQQSQHTSILIQPDSSSYQPASSTGAENYSKSQFEIGPGAKQDPHRIGGLRRRWFWLLIALIAVVVIGASVGGAVGGTHANKSSDSGAASSKTSASSQPSSSSSFSSTGTSTASTASGTSTSTSSSASSSPTAITNCPSVNGETYTPDTPSGRSGSYTFTKTCGGYDTDGTDPISANIATFDECISLCSTWNYVAESLVPIQCTSVVYLGDTSCYAKNGTKAVKSTTYPDAAVALLNG